MGYFPTDVLRRCITVRDVTQAIVRDFVQSPLCAHLSPALRDNMVNDLKLGVRCSEDWDAFRPLNAGDCVEHEGGLCAMLHPDKVSGGQGCVVVLYEPVQTVRLGLREDDGCLITTGAHLPVHALQCPKLVSCIACCRVSSRPRRDAASASADYTEAAQTAEVVIMSADACMALPLTRAQCMLLRGTPGYVAYLHVHRKGSGGTVGPAPASAPALPPASGKKRSLKRLRGGEDEGSVAGGAASEAEAQEAQEAPAVADRWQDVVAIASCASRSLGSVQAAQWANFWRYECKDMVTWRRMLRIMSTTFLRGVMSPAVLGDAALVAAVVQRFEMFVVGNTDCSLLHLLQGSVVTTVASGAEIESAVGQWAGLVQRGVCTVATVMELQSWLWLDVLQVIVDIVHFWKTHCDVIFKSTGCPATERPVLEGVVHLAASMVYAATYSRHASGSLSLTWRSVLHTIVSKLMPALRVSRPTLARLTCGALVMATAGKMPCLWTADKCPKKGLHAPMSGGGRAFPRCLLAPPKVPLRTEWHQPSHHSVQWLVRTIVSPDVARDVCSVLLDELPCADTFALGMGAEVQAVYDVLKEIAREATPDLDSEPPLPSAV